MTETKEDIQAQDDQASGEGSAEGRFDRFEPWLGLGASLGLCLSYPVFGASTISNEVGTFNVVCILSFMGSYSRMKGEGWREYHPLAKVSIVLFWCGMLLYAATNKDLRDAIPGY